MQSRHPFLRGDDLELDWGVPGLGDGLDWGGEVTRDAQGCGGGGASLELLERDVILKNKIGPLDQA